jgi:hypothetical protein
MEPIAEREASEPALLAVVAAESNPEQRLLAVHNQVLRCTLELALMAQGTPVSVPDDEDLPDDHPSIRTGVIQTAVVHFEAGLEALAAALAFHGPLPS